MDFIKIKDFCASMGTIKKVKIQSTKWKEIYANHISSLVSRIYKELLQLNNKKINNLILKMNKGLEPTFLKRRYKMTNKHVKRCSASLAIREIQIETTRRYHLTPVI